MESFHLNTWNDGGEYHLYCHGDCSFFFSTPNQETFFEVMQNHIRTAHSERKTNAG